MSAIKHFMEDAYYKHEDGVSIEDIAKFYNVSEQFVQEAIAFMKEAYKEMEGT